MINPHKKITIFISYHKPSTLLKSDILTPIHVGRELSQLSKMDREWTDRNLIGDNTGDNISSKNPYYCELTAQYWAWKNCDADYIGFMHYRRHLNFNVEVEYETSRWGLIENNILDSSYIERFHLDDERISKLVESNDIIVADEWSVKNQHSKNNYDHYRRSSKYLHIEDYDRALAILLHKYPEYRESVDIYNNSESGYFTNIFIFKRELFLEYSEWLFSILFELEKEIDISNYSTQEARVFGYISEWLFGIFVTQKSATTPIRKLQRTFVEEASFIQRKESVSVCFATDDRYIPHLATAIASIIDNYADERNLDIYILHDGSLRKRSKAGIRALSNRVERVNIIFVVIDTTALCGLTTPSYAHFTDAAYYRYIIPSLLGDIDRVIYLDSDLVAVSDISELYDIDLKGKTLGAVQDLIGNESQVRLSLDRTQYHYCNSGVLVMDLSRMRALSVQERLIDFTVNHYDKLRYFDQDAINVVLEDEITYLDLSWNLQYYKKNRATDYDKERFSQAIAAPKIIHYIGKVKPWDNGNNRPYKSLYWRYLRQTPFYTRVLLKSLFPIKFLRIFIRFDRDEEKDRLRILGLPIYKRLRSVSPNRLYLLGVRIK